MAPTFQDELLRTLNIRTTIKVLERSLLTDALGKGEYDMQLSTDYGTDTPDPELLWTNQLRSGGTQNWSKYSNQKLDQILDQLQTASEDAARERLFRQGMEVLDENPPFYLAGFADHLPMWRKHVKGVVANWHHTQWGRLHTVWLDAEPKVPVYIQRRLLATIPTLIGISLLIFIAMRVLPGDPVSFTLSEGQGVHILSEEQKQQARASLALDRPYHEQYLTWMGSVLRGDLGTSFWRGEKTMDLIARRGPITAQIALMAVSLAWLVGVPAGLVSGIGRNTPVDYLSRVAFTFLMAVPSFWLGLMFVLGAVLLFTWRPPLSIIYMWDDPLGNLQITLGPAIAMGLGLAAVLARFTRSASLEVLGEDYVRTARAKGLTERMVVLRHVFKNSLLPIITVSGLALGGLLGGSVAVERAFGVPGLGLALVFALSERDWNVIQNLVLLYGVIFTLVNLAIDVSYAWFDPRIRY